MNINLEKILAGESVISIYRPLLGSLDGIAEPTDEELAAIEAELEEGLSSAA